MVTPTRHRLSKLAPRLRLLVAIRAVPVFSSRRLTKCLRSNSESVVLGDLAHATRHNSSIQRRRRSPTNTLSHNMHILRSVGVPTKPDQLHFHYFTPIRSWFLRHAIPFVRSISALESASRLEWFEVEWSVSRWMRSTLFLVRCESLGTSSGGCRPSSCSRSVRRRQDSEFFTWRWETLARVLEVLNARVEPLLRRNGDGMRLVDRSGQPDVTRNVIEAHSTFSEDTRIEHTHDRSKGNLMSVTARTHR